MKAKHKNLMLFLSFLTILMISVPQLQTTKSQDEIDIYNLGSSQVSWNVSDYTEFTGPPIDTYPPSYLEVFRIFVDDEDPNYNWSKTAAENAWCSGSGTPGDPYIIEGLYIDAQGDGGGIYIKDSVKNFIIRDCWVNNSGTRDLDSGVLVRWSENGIIENNIFSYIETGVWLEFDCSNITVSGNYMVSDSIRPSRGINCGFNSANIDIIGNVIVNFRGGMYIYRNVTDCTLSQNYLANFIFEEWEDAPVDFFLINDSEAIYNTLDGVYAQRGVFVDVSGGGDNIITNNTVVSAESVDVPEIPILSGGPKLQATDKVAVNLNDCYNNLVAHNIVLEHSSEEAIPGYDTLLILSLAGIMITVLAIKISFKKFKR